MRYGKPSIKEMLNNLFDYGCTRILIMPLYPQYAASTTATVQDEVFKWMLKKRWQPSIRTIPPWYDNDNYIEAISNSIKKSITKKNSSEVLIISFRRESQKDICILEIPYHCHCIKNWTSNKREIEMAR